MKRYDTFMFNNEVDVLECRLTELDSIVDVFVIVEGNHTHGGNKPKPWHYLDNKDRFSPWADRIRYIQAIDLPDSPDPWTRERAQRECIVVGLSDAGSEDIVMVSDVDEIPKAPMVRNISPGGDTVFMMTLYAMSLDWYDPIPWFGTAATRMCELVSPNRLRENRRWATTQLHDAGWHLSWLGGEAAMSEKYWSGCHSGDYEAKWDTTTGEFLDSQLVPVDLDMDTNYPLWVREGHAPESWKGISC